MKAKIDNTLFPIGFVRSTLRNLKDAPHQGYEGAPDAWVEINSKYTEGLDGINVGDEIILITWFHLSDRDVLKVHPQNNKRNPLTGVFATRSPDRPNPLGIHPVKVLEIQGNRLKVQPLEAIDGTPLIDIKPVI
ncbi:MAG: tRNA (N6-threonylcarbamoyladenosine(37)-N6)-methyltransferase TrmO [Bacteroidota bacterium]